MVNFNPTLFPGLVPSAAAQMCVWAGGREGSVSAVSAQAQAAQSPGEPTAGRAQAGASTARVCSAPAEGESGRCRAGCQGGAHGPAAQPQLRRSNLFISACPVNPQSFGTPLAVLNLFWFELEPRLRNCSAHSGGGVVVREGKRRRPGQLAPRRSPASWLGTGHSFPERVWVYSEREGISQ